MIAILQRVSEAKVEVAAKTVGEIGAGLMVLFAVCEGDTEQEMTFLCDKMTDLRIFADDKGKMNRSLIDTKGEILLISQFTLCADWIKGRRPGFTKAAPAQMAEQMYKNAINTIRNKGIRVESGVFGKEMKITQSNEGPVTLILDSREKFGNPKY